MNLRITDLLDDYMDEQLYMDPAAVPDTKRIKEAAMKRIHRKKITRPVRVALIAAAIVVVLTGTVLAVIHYSGITDAMEQKWNASGSTEMTQEHKDFIEQRSADIGESVTDQGITVTVDSVTTTTDRVYLMLRCEFDPEQFDDVEQIATCFPSHGLARVENEAYGTLEVERVGGRDEMIETGVFNVEVSIDFENLPEDANLGDGKTTMYLEYNTVSYNHELEGPDYVDVTGTWSFAFSLPQSENVTVSIDETLSFDGTELDFGNGIVITVGDIQLDENSCDFSVTTDNEDYIFVGGDGMQAELARAAQPDVPTFSMFAVLENGEMAYGAAGMTWDEGTDTDRWSLDWATPVDPESVVSLIFSDGTTEIEVPLNS